MSHYVYKFYNKDNDIIYVGRTSEGIKKRISSHFSVGHLPSECYDSVNKIDYIKLHTKAETKIVELYLINLHKPFYNTQDKEYKSLEVSVEFKMEWKSFPFQTREEIKEINLQHTNAELRREIQKLKHDISEIHTENSKVNTYYQNKVNSLQELLDLKFSAIGKPINIYNNRDFKIDEYTIEYLYMSDEFKDIIFVGELKINNDLLERIVIKKEKFNITYTYEMKNQVYTRDMLTKEFSKLFSENMHLNLILNFGFVPLDTSEELWNRMKEYIGNKEYINFQDIERRAS